MRLKCDSSPSRRLEFPSLLLDIDIYLITPYVINIKKQLIQINITDAAWGDGHVVRVGSPGFQRLRSIYHKMLFQIMC